jgi:hypothetical protein
MCELLVGLPAINVLVPDPASPNIVGERWVDGKRSPKIRAHVATAA